MPFYDLAADGQTDTRAGVFVACMEPLEHLKDTLEVLRRDPNAVVPNGENPLTPAGSGSNMNLWSVPVAVFDGVPNQILKQLRKLHCICQHIRQRSDVH